MDDLVITEQTLDELVLNYEISSTEEELLKKELLESGETELPLGGKKYDASSTQLRNDYWGYSGIRA
jgi:hypothetical protein